MVAALASACAPDATGPIVVARDAGRADARVDGGRDAGRTDAGPGGDTGLRDTGGGGNTDRGPNPGDTGGGGNDAGPIDAGPPRCGMGIDSDGDGLNNDDECARGTNPFNRDSDMDGIADGDEVNYPRGCVSPSNRTQRRPPPRCTDDAMCMTGERCRGIDPAQRDSDNDGVADGDEDTNFDGTIDQRRGETDPRLADTDGDGVPDSMGGIAICRPQGLASVVQLGLPESPTQIGYDPQWGTARRVTGGSMRGAVVMEDARAQTAGLVASLPSSGDVRVEATRIEASMVTALGAGTTPVLTGRTFTTHDMNPAITSTYRVARATTADALRDAVTAALVGPTPPPGVTLPMTGEFLVDVTTIRRTMGRSAGVTNVLVTVAPRVAYESPGALTAIRAVDLVNGTGIAEADQGLGANCQVFRADRISQADFLWTVDTSGSMNDDQERLGRTATQFFNRLRSAGVDFRVGVITAGSGVLNLDSPGFRWISGTDMNGASELCNQVTYGTCPGSTNDRLAPYPFAGGQEEPTSAAVIATSQMYTRAMAGETNPDRRFRMGARVVTFHVTDEPGSNDYSRYFQRSSDPQTMSPWGGTYPVALPNIVTYFRRNQVLTFGLVPVSTTPCANNVVNDLPRCVIEGNGGAVINITTATDAEVSAAMMRIVEAIAGASSQFVLERQPITSTIKVRVRGSDVPRSRVDGFDYDGPSRALVFYGATYRPNIGDEVAVSYRVWRACTASGMTCAGDADCCAPQTCRSGRCSPPCTETGGTCTGDGDCCAPNTCQMGRCMPVPMCRPRGATCTPTDNPGCCPPSVCVNGTCGDCLPTDGVCTRASDCCSGACTNGRCACRPTSGRCTSPVDCCSRFCANGLCAPG